ncbi:hypothetical protein KAJ83_17590 [Marivibrio halodurans]|uniref:CVNH domain-containing protein n=1 Tax=Marivibrio halodurans TaxID=2039722 RepID=A0A8J7V3Z9_9PROT|nr:hypothetical protein [Marivibrio halodurans]MBP5858836.1 hypothetical protein [Marivibrio halodurans]
MSVKSLPAWLALGLVLVFAHPVHAAMPAQGDSCTDDGASIWGGPAFLVCNGSTWQEVFEYDSAGKVLFTLDNDASACDSDHAGSMRFNAEDTRFEGCDGDNWVSMNGESEIDPQVGTLMSGGFCRSNGSAVDCTVSMPICESGEMLTSDGSTLSCVAAPTGGAPAYEGVTISSCSKSGSGVKTCDLPTGVTYYKTVGEGSYDLKASSGNSLITGDNDTSASILPSNVDFAEIEGKTTSSQQCTSHGSYCISCCNCAPGERVMGSQCTNYKTVYSHKTITIEWMK